MTRELAMSQAATCWWPYDMLANQANWCWQQSDSVSCLVNVPLITLVLPPFCVSLKLGLNLYQVRSSLNRRMVFIVLALLKWHRFSVVGLSSGQIGFDLTCICIRTYLMNVASYVRMLAFPTINYCLANSWLGDFSWWFQSHVSMTFLCMHHQIKP